jgi:hypothetical protein
MARLAMHDEKRLTRPLKNRSLPLLSRRSAIFRGLLLLTGAATVASARAGRPDKLPFKIAAGTAPEALTEFVRQSGFQVLYDFDAIRHVSTHEVSGQLDPSQALNLMFEGSGLTFEFINERTISVRPRAPSVVPVAQPTVSRDTG